MNEIDLYIQHKEMELQYGGGENLFHLSGGRFISDEDENLIFIFEINKDEYKKLSETSAEFLRVNDRPYKFEFLN